MPRPHLFEFCDQSWMPNGARECLFESMDLCNTGYRSFNRRVADQALAIVEEHGLNTIVEIGAGRAPITTLLAEDERANGVTLVPCDVSPNMAVFQALEQRYPGRVAPFYESMDVTQPHNWPGKSLLLFCGIMHHIPFSLRDSIVRTLGKSRIRVAVFEPLRCNFLSMFLATLAVFLALWLPIAYFKRPGRLRRFFWCWCLPIVPIAFVWDGVISCLRQWTTEEWQASFARCLENEGTGVIECSRNSMVIQWHDDSKEVLARTA